jgi:ketosteroid isomerase-like protein
MRKTTLLLIPVFAMIFGGSCGAQAPSGDVSAKVIAMERAALDRWGKGDPQGYIDIFAPEITYFDPNTEKRIDNKDAMVKYLEPIKGLVKVGRFDMVDPRVQVHEAVALLTFNLKSYVKAPDGSEKLAAYWNSTETYARIGNDWRIIHSHWSYVKPDIKRDGLQ